MATKGHCSLQQYAAVEALIIPRTYLTAETAETRLPHHGEDLGVVGVLGADVAHPRVVIITDEPRLSRREALTCLVCEIWTS